MINRVIRQLIMYDFIMQFAFGLLSPIFAVFLLNNIEGSTLKVIGLSATCYWVARVISTVPLSRLMDRLDGERDEFYFAVCGAFLASCIPLMYLLAYKPWHIFVIQFAYGLFNSMAVPAWRILFVDHIDKGRVGFEWSLNDVDAGIAIAISASVGSFIAEAVGFQFLFILVSILGFIATMMLIPLHHDANTLAEIKREKKLPLIKKRRRTTGILNKGAIRAA